MTTGALVPVAPLLRVPGHFGEFLQGRLGPEGPLVLVTVPCAALGVEVRAAAGPFGVDALVSEDQARRLFGALGGVPDLRFQLRAEAPPGGGAGMSTAALMALALAAEREADGAALLQAEGAVDPLMLEAPGDVLWASREARVVTRFAPLPAFEIVGGFWGPPEQTAPKDLDFADVDDLVAFWGPAVTRGDRAALAGIATEATRRTTALRGPESDPTEDLARELGALGTIRAHTGSARGLLYAPGNVPAGAASALQEAGFDGILSFRTDGPAP